MKTTSVPVHDMQEKEMLVRDKNTNINVSQMLGAFHEWNCHRFWTRICSFPKYKKQLNATAWSLGRTFGRSRDKGKYCNHPLLFVCYNSIEAEVIFIQLSSTVAWAASCLSRSLSRFHDTLSGAVELPRAVPHTRVRVWLSKIFSVKRTPGHSP